MAALLFIGAQSSQPQLSATSAAAVLSARTHHSVAVSAAKSSRPVTSKSNSAATPQPPASPAPKVASTGEIATSIPSANPSRGPTKSAAISGSTKAPAPQPQPVVPPAPVGDIAPESVCPGQESLASTTTVLSCMTSYARSQHGLSGIMSNGPLMAAAAAKDQDMLSCGYSHTACGRPFNYWFSVKGYTGNCSAENIAQGQQSPLEVFTAWMNSPGHRANILGTVYRDIGVAVINTNAGPDWVMELGGC